jgi:hypothetical protein
MNGAPQNTGVGVAVVDGGAPQAAVVAFSSTLSSQNVTDQSGRSQAEMWQKVIDGEVANKPHLREVIVQELLNRNIERAYNAMIANRCTRFHDYVIYISQTGVKFLRDLTVSNFPDGKLLHAMYHKKSNETVLGVFCFMHWVRPTGTIPDPDQIISANDITDHAKKAPLLAFRTSFDVENIKDGMFQEGGEGYVAKACHIYSEEQFAELFPEVDVAMHYNTMVVSKVDRTKWVNVPLEDTFHIESSYCCAEATAALIVDPKNKKKNSYLNIGHLFKAKYKSTEPPLR